MSLFVGRGFYWVLCRFLFLVVSSLSNSGLDLCGGVTPYSVRFGLRASTL